MGEHDGARPEGGDRLDYFRPLTGFDAGDAITDAGREGKRRSGVGGWSVSGWVRGGLPLPRRFSGFYRNLLEGRVVIVQGAREVPHQLAITARASSECRVRLSLSVFPLTQAGEKDSVLSIWAGDSPEDGLRNWRYAIPIPPAIAPHSKSGVRTTSFIDDAPSRVCSYPPGWLAALGREALMLLLWFRWRRAAVPRCVG